MNSGLDCGVARLGEDSWAASWSGLREEITDRARRTAGLTRLILLAHKRSLTGSGASLTTKHSAFTFSERRQRMSSGRSDHFLGHR